MKARFLLVITVVILAGPARAIEAPQQYGTSIAISRKNEPIKLLFLGDNGHHRPSDRYEQIKHVLLKRGIDTTYAASANVLNPRTLAGFDGLIVYANIEKITPEQEKALLDFVADGKGFIPIHCASYCFLNSPKYIELVGAQFKSHGTGTFTTTIAEPNHAIMKGYKSFESFDETYVHTKHNDKDRTVLEYRVAGKVKEPWTWVRTHGKGRIFYTAWGHDHRTWGNAGFQDLLVRGIYWATQKGEPPAATDAPPAQLAERPPFPVPEMTPKRKDVQPFEYEDVGNKIPNYKGKGALSKMQKPLPAEESLKHLVLPKGFKAELFAGDPDIRRPICMAWDERGRLWIAESVDYPNSLQPVDKGNDRIIICEDTKGTGRADKFTVFADKLSIPTSMCFWNGGVIVFENRRTLFLKSSKGDDRADIREVLFSGWGMGDTHGGVSNMQYGLDNWIYAMQGYNFSKVTLGGETTSFRQGFFRFKPPVNRRAEPRERSESDNGTSGKIEFLRSTNNNTWGLGISEEGLIFGSTANGNPSVYLPIPNRYYESVKGWTRSLTLGGIADSYKFKAITDKVRQVDFHGGYTAAAGHALYTARNYPQEYWNRTAFVTEPTGHLVGTFVLKPDGSNFTSSNPFNLVASDDEWTSPIMAEVGPDGNVWVIDWYNYIVQHNPTPAGFKTGKGAAYETELRDKKHGRIYRIMPQDERVKPQGEVLRTLGVKTLKDATPEKLVETLKDSNMFWRKHAQRLLVERGKQDVLPALFGLVRNHDMDEIGLNVGAIHALWTLHGLGALAGTNKEADAVAQAALRHPSAGVRRNAAQVLSRTSESTAALLAARLLDDPDAQVRLAALLALADLPPSAKSGEAIAAALQDPRNTRDRWLPDAATCAAANNAEFFLKSLSAGSDAKKEPGAKLLETATIVAEHYARTGPVDTVGEVISKLADADPAIAAATVKGLAKGWPKGKTPNLTEAVEKDLVRLATRLSPGQRGVLVQLAASWGSKSLDNIAAEIPRQLLARVNDDKLAADERIAAARELLELKSGDKKLPADLLELITPRTTPELAAGLLGALQASQSPQTGQLIVDKLPGLTPAARSVGVSVVLGRPEWTAPLLEQIEKGKILLSELSLDQKQALAAHPNAEIKKRALELLAKGGALPNADRQKVIDELLPVTRVKGDAAAGKLVFKNVCAKCHVHSGEGTRIGPDLTGMFVHSKEHLLVDILDPSRSVEGNFRIYQVSTARGLLYSGMLASESKTAIELVFTDGKKVTVLREDIDEMTASPKSLMPDGFEKELSKQQLTDLLEFLTQRGKYLPLPLDKAATVITTRGMFYSEDASIERLIFPDWQPRTFEGVPFQLVDPQGDKTRNAIMLYSPNGKLPPTMPRTVSLPVNMPARAIHFLSGVSGWGYPYDKKTTVAMIVRLHYEDGTTEDHALKNGEHFADYIRRVDVPGSKFAFDLNGRQIRYLSVQPKRGDKIVRIELVKGPDASAPVVMAITVEGRE